MTYLDTFNSRHFYLVLASGYSTLKRGGMYSSDGQNFYGTTVPLAFSNISINIADINFPNGVVFVLDPRILVGKFPLYFSFGPLGQSHPNSAYTIFCC